MLSGAAATQPGQAFLSPASREQPMAPGVLVARLHPGLSSLPTTPTRRARPGVPLAASGKGSYVYTNLASLRASDARANVYGVVCSFTHRYQSKGRDVTVSLSLVDESQPDPESAVPCNFFMPTGDGLPGAVMVGDIVRVHRAKASSGGAFLRRRPCDV